MEPTEDELTARARRRVGQVLQGKWKLDALLGVGGMAAVYGATHRNGKEVAVKMLHPEISLDASIRERFLREGYVGNKVKHEGAVSVLDDDISEDGSAFLVMELLDGETLEARRERKGGKLEANEVLSIADCVLDTLAAAHEKGIVHRDLKPENLFLTRTGAVKVLDFGIARLREGGANASATQTGSMMGTPAFMPPEQARGRWNEVDGRTDLWALGASMFTLLTGQFVHDAETVNEVMAKAITERARPIASVESSVPASVAEVIDRALAYEKEHRWADARGMQAALRAAYHGVDASNVAARASIPDSETESAIAPAEGISSRKPMTVAGVTASARCTGPRSFRKSSAVIAAAVGVCTLGVLGLVLGRSAATSEQGTAASAPSEHRADPTAAEPLAPSPSAAEPVPTIDSAAVDLATIPVQPSETPGEKMNKSHARSSTRPSSVSGTSAAPVAVGSPSSTTAHDTPPAVTPTPSSANILLKRR